MNKNIVIGILFSLVALINLTACSSSPRTDNHKINCDKMHLDSQTKLSELQRVFNAYQDINLDLALKLSQPYKEEVVQLDSRVRKQKQRCWKDEERALDNDMADLKLDVIKIYGSDNDLIAKPVKKRALRSMASVPPKETSAVTEKTSSSFELPEPEPVPMGAIDSDVVDRLDEF